MRLPAKATHQQTRANNQGLVAAHALRPGPDQPGRGGAPHRPDPHHRQRRRHGLPRRGPGRGGRPRAVERRQGADPRRGHRRRPPSSSGSTWARRRSSGRSSTCAARSATASIEPVDGRDGDAALAAVERLVDELVAAAPRHRCSASASAPRARRHGHRDHPLGRQPRLAGPAARAACSASGTASRPTSPTTRAPRPWASTCSTRAGPGRQPRRDQGRHGHRRRASSSAASCSRATASAPARSGTPPSSTTARPAAAAGSAASRRSPARGAVDGRGRELAAEPGRALGDARRGPLTVDDVAAASRTATRTRAASRSPRAAGSAGRSPA